MKALQGLYWQSHAYERQAARLRLGSVWGPGEAGAIFSCRKWPSICRGLELEEKYRENISTATTPRVQSKPS